MSETQAPTPSFAQQIRWPLIVAALLVGHAAMMLVALAMSMAAPLELSPEYRDATLQQPPTAQSPRTRE